ncbi:Endoplasmic reticulum transmembrane protein 3 [Basidiobolus ranarum]|uniref:Endoplasmic reticulum transmembrane protein n=1 Tax=Basidiobolus ranarum TaxID=34480 RepID=A0ABR2X148_9FUNG
MALYYSIVFGFMITQMSLFLLMVSPFPQRFKQSILMKIDSSKWMHKINFYVNIGLFFVFILFVDSIIRMVNSTEEANVANQADPRTDSQLHLRKFYSQRNFYLTGFTLFLSLILNRTFFMMMDLYHAEVQVGKLRNGHSNGKPKYVERSEVDHADNVRRIEELRKEVDELRKKERNIDQLKERTGKEATEYHNLSKEHENLVKI